MFWSIGSAAAGWIALALVLATSSAGFVLRRFRKVPPLAIRMRPHYALAYGVLGLTAVHVLFAMGLMRGANETGIYAATFALFALGGQTFVGVSLQDPGSYRTPLRRWHVALLAILVATIGVHVMANAAFAR